MTDPAAPLRPFYRFLVLSLSASSWLFAQEKPDFDPFSDEAAEALAKIQETAKPNESRNFLEPGQVRQLNELAQPSLVTVRQIGRDGKTQGTGSGFVIAKEGLIVTNLHVIGEARPVEVEFADGKKFNVISIHASDRHYDLAILKIDPGSELLTPLVVGDSSAIQQGELIVGFGAPQGLSFSVVPGVISAIRKLEEGFVGDGETPEYPMLQLAMPIEQGNSGGPILNLKGEVLGVVTLRHRVTENLGFAVASNDLKLVLEKPNPVPMKRWRTIGTLNERLWAPVMGGGWIQRGGIISADEMGDGFGGRSLLLSSAKVPEAPYEISVMTKLDDESGAAGLAFAADGGDVHYGFYPSGGKIRLTRFEGADVYSWSILEQLEVTAYKRGEWNHLRIRVEESTITGWVNDEKVLELEDDELREGKVGLCKFRRTEAEFRNFRVGKSLEEKPVDPEILSNLSSHLDGFIDSGLSEERMGAFSGNWSSSRELIRAKAEEIEALAASLRSLEEQVYRDTVINELTMILDRPESEIDLFEVGLQIARLEDPEMDVEHYRSVFRQLIEAARKYVEKSARDGSAKERVTALTAFLFKENGFHGSRAEYYHSANSYVNSVLDDREGIPITLSVVFIEMARRLKIEGVFGAPLPGKFMVGICHGEGDAIETEFIDVFESGTLMSRAKAVRAVWELLGSTPPDSVFEPAKGRDIAARMLRNLVDIEINRKQTPERAMGYLELLIAIQPESGKERFQRAILRVQDDNIRGAREDLDWLMENQPPGLDYRRLEQFRDSLPSR